MDLHNTTVSETASHKDVSAICMFLQDLAAAENLSTHSASSKSVTSLQPALKELTEILRKKDIEINNLCKCKTELSETVVCLRQEIYALRKEKLNSEKEGKESRSKLLMVSERNAALVQELSKLNLENQRLKMEMLALTKEKCKPALYSSIGQPDLPFNTYPWLFPTERSIPPFSSTPIYQLNNRVHKNNEIESCEEISQKLFAQMKLEMKREMEELHEQQCMDDLSENEDLCESCVRKVDGNVLDINKSDEVHITKDEILKMEDIAACLEHEFIAVRLYAMEQNKFIREMLQKVLNFTKTNSPSIVMQTNGKATDVPLSEYSEEVMDNKFQFPRPSDESFRAYFTQQLSGNQQPPLSGIHKSISEERLRTIQTMSGDNNSKPTANFHKGKTWFEALLADPCEPENTSMQEIITASKISVNNNTAVKVVAPSCHDSSPSRVHKRSLDEGKICPMCQAVFPKNTIQEDFETHVFNHFEAENSLLDNFEVIQY